MRSHYIVQKSFWSRDWTFRDPVYKFYSSSSTVLCSSGLHGDMPWHFCVGQFTAYTEDGRIYASSMDLETLITYLESTGRSWAVACLQMFCADACIEWPPDVVAMELYLQHKDSIWDRFVQHVGPTA